MSDDGDNCIWVALESDKAYIGNRDYPSISSFYVDCEVSEKLQLDTRVVNGYEERYFKAPVWKSETSMSIAADVQADYNA